MTTIQVYNSLTRQKEALQPISPGRIGMYVCGPTVYSDCHIGHLMGPILFDAIARWFIARGFAVRFVNNITDIDDKIINRSLESGEPWQAITERYTAQYFDFLQRLGVSTITDHPKATEHIPGMIAYIQDLIDRGMAYAGDDGVYFEVSKKDGYGKLSGRRADDMRSGARIERGSCLHHPGDFALWKAAKPGEPSWESPWGAGRPGWHIECSVMTNALLGDSFDIHGGGDDLKFPHHENEIAQGEAHGGEYARVWMHNGLIQYEGAKISKSDPRNADPAFAGQFKAQHLLDTYGPATVRFFFLQGHYRRPFDFAPQHLRAAGAALERLHRQLGPLLDEPGQASLEEILARPLESEAGKRVQQFCAAMDDDFNTGAAFGHLFAIAGLAKKADGQMAQLLLQTLRDCGRLLGCFQPGDQAGSDQGASGEAQNDGDELSRQLMELILSLRAEARAKKDFATADAIRDGLKALRITVADGPQGSSWTRET
ncbi:MAG: cysteine--tRNA ligase [Planctomycetota bacterium]|nr:MAG: cysteine--tRNA ligase [Planctomycetota bacterium]